MIKLGAAWEHLLEKQAAERSVKEVWGPRIKRLGSVRRAQGGTLGLLRHVGVEAAKDAPRALRALAARAVTRGRAG